ncbi:MULTISPECIES: pilus assembly protein PilB [unclassified Marinobacter]|uniref:pilus assembly protein PilB n=1 Tax=unclassified Marinobacter TaxID=83889 RepID=UPI0019296761|nr:MULTISPECIES: pilus assembly protein PilB [unclassified Marinobacter]MBL3824161.1 pilus assembly protein PilB [Marinobacter sp. MC3]MBL3892747.1 pilus assembly protein PilB [Marinobacter sp. MW3]
MRIRQGFEEKSRLGRLLINRGYLSEGQLDEGLRLQRETGQRLGEVFIQAGWISEKELYRVLKHQSRYRNAAALVTMVTLPFQPLVTFAASNSAEASQSALEAGELYERGNLAPLSESELATISGQGDPTLLERIGVVSSMAENPTGDGSADVIEGLKLTANIFVPVLNFIDSDLSISGVHYREGEPRYRVREDGALMLAFPERIEEIRMDNIRVSGSQGASMGNVSIHDIRFHPDSQMTIYTR